MKIAVSSYSFNKMIRSGEITEFDTIRLAKEIGFDGIEFVDFYRPEDEDLLEYAKMLRAEADRVGIPIVNYAIGASFAREGEDFDKEVERVKAHVDAAEIFGSSFMRHDAMGGVYGLGDFKTFDDCLEIVSKGCRIITEYAEKKGIRTMVENHGLICQDPDRIEALVRKVDYPNFGVLADMGNFLCADCEPSYSVGRLRERIFFVHAKDFIVKDGNGADPGKGFFRSRGGNYLRGTIIGHGNVPVKKCIDVLENAEYDGWITIEFEGMEDTKTGLEIGLENLRNYIS